MSEASATFDQELRAVVLAPLRDHGFAFDGSRTFRRTIGDGTVAHVVNFQLGQRSRHGQFAVNLGVFVAGDADAFAPGLEPRRAREYHCPTDRRERLGRLLPCRFPVLARLPLLYLLFGPSDVWWRFSADRALTRAGLTTALAVLEAYGLRWLAGVTPGPPVAR